MSKYTLIYKEFNDVGGQLPTSFDKVVNLFTADYDFKGAFESRNYWKEIGGETLEAFENQIDAVARRIYPKLKQQLDVLSTGVNGRNWTETTAQDITQTLDGTFDKGAIDRIQRNLAHAPITSPLNNEDVVNGFTDNTTSGQDVTHSTNANNGTITKTGEEKNTENSIRWADFHDRFNYLFEDALKAFDICFLGVW